LREHDEANKILDMKTRKEKVDYYESLKPWSFKRDVGDLVRMAQKAAEYNRHFAWRVHRDD